MQCGALLPPVVVWGGRSAGLVYCTYVLESYVGWQNIEWWWYLLVAADLLWLFCCKIFAVVFKIHSLEH